MKSITCCTIHFVEAIHTAVLIIHVLGAAIIVGISFVTVLIELKTSLTNKQIMSLTEFLWKVATRTLGVQVLTGLYLAISEWDQIGKNHFFWTKMIVFIVLGAIVGGFNHRRFKKLKAGEPDTYGRKWSTIGFLTFATVAALGVLLAESIS